MKSAEDLQKIMENEDWGAMVLVYSRDKGFSDLAAIENNTAEITGDFIRSYLSRIEKDSRFRDVTYKTIIITLLVLSVIVFLILIFLAPWYSALICFFILFSFAYFLGFLQAKKLHILRKEYGLKIMGTDWEHFGCWVENVFGSKEWKFYLWFCFIKPKIRLSIRYKKVVDMPAVEGARGRGKVDRKNSQEGREKVGKIEKKAPTRHVSSNNLHKNLSNPTPADPNSVSMGPLPALPGAKNFQIPFPKNMSKKEEKEEEKEEEKKAPKPDRWEGAQDTSNQGVELMEDISLQGVRRGDPKLLENERLVEGPSLARPSKK